MKKVLLAIAVIFAAGISYGFSSADDDGYTIEIYSITDEITRSVIALPEASISHDILSVTFDASGIYALYVEDSFGGTVYSSALPADGMEYTYDLSGIGTGQFRLLIEGAGGEYEGYFTCN